MIWTGKTPHLSPGERGGANEKNESSDSQPCGNKGKTFEKSVCLFCKYRKMMALCLWVIDGNDIEL